MITDAAPVALIVEDDQTIGHMLSLMLKLQGYQPLVAPTATAALVHLRTFQPAVITLDLNLPGMSGAAFLEHIRAMPETVDVPVIIVTAHPNIPRSLRSQVQHVLTKPFDMGDFSAALHEATEPVLLSREVGERFAA